LWNDFVEISQTVFAPLEKKFGFRRLPPKEPFVNYESSCLQIRLFYADTREGKGELDMAIRRLIDVGTQKKSTHVSGLMAIYDPVAWENHSMSFATDRQSLESVLLATRENLFKYGASLLAGDLSDLDKLDCLEKALEKELGKHRGGDYKSIVKQGVLNFFHANS
ncbi:MAG: hypothetical protein RLZZ350_91, partial [Verrucomicrobiota bacterium]|jgi:hypothetical protein